MKKHWKLLLVIPTILFIGAGCLDTTNPEATAVQENQNKMVQAVPLPNLDNSLERINIKKRLETFDQPNKVSYIYLISFGKVMSFYTIKGKVTSGGKRLTAQTVNIDNCGNVTNVGIQTPCSGSYSVERPELDGTYGSSNPYIFFWTTDGVYVQWSGDYMLVDQPLQLTTQPELVRTIK